MEVGYSDFVSVSESCKTNKELTSENIGACRRLSFGKDGAAPTDANTILSCYAGTELENGTIEGEPMKESIFSDCEEDVEPKREHVEGLKNGPNEHYRNANKDMMRKSREAAINKRMLMALRLTVAARNDSKRYKKVLQTAAKWLKECPYYPTGHHALLDIAMQQGACKEAVDIIELLQVWSQPPLCENA